MREAARFLRDVVTMRARASVQEVAEEMKAAAVGCIVVVDDRGRPVGLVTDRDLAVRVVANGLRSSEVTAGEVMSQPLITAAPGDSIEAVMARMSANGIRRVPIVRDERVVGLVSLEDLVFELGRDLNDLGEMLSAQFPDVRRGAPSNALRDELRERIAGLAVGLERASERTRKALLRDLDALRERVQRP